MSDTELLDWMGRNGFGCHHDARTQKWVSMAGCRFASPRAALIAAVERVRALKCPEADAVDPSWSTPDSALTPPVSASRAGSPAEPRRCECGHEKRDHEQGVYMCAFAVPDCDCNAFRASPAAAAPSETDPACTCGTGAHDTVHAIACPANKRNIIIALRAHVATLEARLLDAERREEPWCPECGGDGCALHPFDGHCPCSWAHKHVAPLKDGLCLRAILSAPPTEETP